MAKITRNSTTHSQTWVLRVLVDPFFLPIDIQILN